MKRIAASTVFLLLFVPAMALGFLCFIEWLDARQDKYYATHDEVRVCGEVTHSRVAGGWRQSDDVYYEVLWDDGIITQEQGYPSSAPYVGEKICKDVWLTK
jgi:hypothetical protein